MPAMHWMHLDASCVRCALRGAHGQYASSPRVGSGLGGRQFSADHSTAVPGSESELNTNKVRAPPGGMLVLRGRYRRSSPCSGDAIPLVTEAMATRTRRILAWDVVHSAIWQDPASTWRWRLFDEYVSPRPRESYRIS